MKTVLTCLISILTCSLQAQSIEKFSIDSGGDNFNDGNIQVLYTIGEVNVQELITGDLIVSEGFINSIDSGPLGINDYIVNKIMVFPNPTSNYINIMSELPISLIEIFDLLGKRILTKKIQNHIDVSHLQSGIYLVKIYSEKGQETKRFIKQ